MRISVLLILAALLLIGESRYRYYGGGGGMGIAGRNYGNYGSYGNYGNYNYNYNNRGYCRVSQFVDYVGRTPRFYCDCPPYPPNYQWNYCSPIYAGK